MKALNRPAKILSSTFELDLEFEAARRTYHRLLDFEEQHQAHLDEVAQACAPGILKVSRVLAKLQRFENWHQRASSGWRPRSRADLIPALRSKLVELRKVRNADPRWKEALNWADAVPDGAPERGTARRRASETDEDFAARCAKRRTQLNRREIYRAELYKNRRVYWGTWNGLLRSADQARKTVVQARASGTSARIRRPKFNDSQTLYADPNGFRVVERSPTWWVLEMRLNDGWVRFKAKCGNWHPLTDDTKLKTCQLTRSRRGLNWEYSVSIAVAGLPSNQEQFATRGLVALDWGHRERGHDSASVGIRAFTWVGDDGKRGEILQPAVCRELLDKTHDTLARMDDVFNARRKTFGLPEKNRHTYRRRLILSGVLTEEESHWLAWEHRYEMRVSSMRRRIQNIRKETYIQAVRALRKQYKTFAVEDETGKGHRKLDKTEMSPLRKRQNRDMVARYAFLLVCKQYGADIVEVPSKNTTRECPECGHLSENTAELYIACEGCGTVRDKDYGAGIVIKRRAQSLIAA